MKKKWVVPLISVVFLMLLIAITVKIAGNWEREGDKQSGEQANAGQAEENQDTGEQGKTEDQDKKSEEASEKLKKKIINKEGMTLETRFSVPEGYVREAAQEGSFAQFLRTYEVKEDGSPVLLYDGREKGRQNVHAAVFKLPIEAEDLQQCADSIMRMYAEYFYHTGQSEKIAFHFSGGFLAEYEKWKQGNRIKIDGNQAYWARTASYDDSYETFCAFMRMVFAYAGTQSMVGETEEISLPEIQIGDVFLKGGSPGHVVMVADVCQRADGKKAFLLAQGYMPAQEFHVLNNPAHGEDPWYYEEEIEYPLVTPEYTFEEGSLRRLVYIK